MCFLSQLVERWDMLEFSTLARAVPSGMAPPASCDDSAKAGAMSDLKKQLLQVVFW